MSLFDAVLLLLVTAALLAPLLYGVMTLHGMRHKRFYPILRWTEPLSDGPTSPDRDAQEQLSQNSQRDG